MRNTPKAIPTSSDVARSCPDLGRFRRDIVVSVSLLARFGSPEEAVRAHNQSPSLESDGFTVFPMKITHHSRQYFETRFDKHSVSVAARDFESSSIWEATRNVYQHGHRFHNLADPTAIPGEVHAAIAVKEISVTGPQSTPIKGLLVAVMDAGPGIYNPAQSLVDGIGNEVHGGQCCGMGIELRYSLVYIVRSKTDGWFLYDGFSYSKNPHPAVDIWTQGARHARVEPLGRIDLPSPEVGCQKIFFCPAEHSTDGEKQWLAEQILTALSLNQRPELIKA